MVAILMKKTFWMNGGYIRLNTEIMDEEQNLGRKCENKIRTLQSKNFI